MHRWSSDGTSIFSVADGHALAQTPPKEPTHFERIRAERLARAQLETPLVRGLRLMPEYTPGRCRLCGLTSKSEKQPLQLLSARPALCPHALPTDAMGFLHAIAEHRAMSRSAAYLTPLAWAQ